MAGTSTAARTQRAERTFLGLAALLFVAAAGVTVLKSASMSAMPIMQMPGGGRASMAWMRMPGESWAGAFASFLVMWLAMMLAMMLPALVPVLQRYRARVGGLGPALLAGLGYFGVAAALGAAIFPAGAALAVLHAHWQWLSQAAPLIAGLVIIGAGFFQFTSWKAHHLARCREVRARCGAPCTDALGAWRSGVRLGLHCCCCCAPQMAILLVLGVMDLRAMVLVSAALTAERLPLAGPSIAKGAGAVAVGVGLLWIARAAGIT
jgi:predicted metal-binding membrane protein